MRRSATPYLFAAPFFVVFVLFLVVPIGYAAYLSLFAVRHQLLGPDLSVFEPLANYVRAFQDSAFLSSIRNAVLYGVIQVPTMLVFSTVTALILDAGTGRARRFLRFAAFLPYAIPGVIAGLLWSYLYSRNVSPINQFLHGAGLDSINFIDPAVILFSVANIVIWVATGYNAVILYAALRNVPQELYDAAAIDGASGLQTIRHIKLPLLRPTLLLTAIFSIIGSLQIFGEPYMLRSLGYVPGDITPNTVIYNAATRDGNFNYAAALAIILGVLTLIASAIFLYTTTRKGRSER
jgi:multiple sugar transport system permease protein